MLYNYTGITIKERMLAMKNINRYYEPNRFEQPVYYNIQGPMFGEIFYSKLIAIPLENE